MPILLLLSSLAVADQVSELPFSLTDEVVVAREEQSVPFGTALDVQDDGWTVTVTLRLVTEVRLGVTVSGTSRLSWDDVGFHHALHDLLTEGRVDVVGTFALDVAITEGGTPLTSATIASVPAVARAVDATPSALGPTSEPLGMGGPGTVDVVAPWASEDAALTFANPDTDPGTALASAFGDLSGDGLVVQRDGAPLVDPFLPDPTDTVPLSLAWSGAGHAGGAFAWTGQLYGVFDVLGLGTITLIVPMDRPVLDAPAAAAALATPPVVVTHQLPRLDLQAAPIDLGGSGVGTPRVTTIAIPAGGQAPLSVRLSLEGEDMMLSTTDLQIEVGRTETVDVVFHPLREGELHGTLRLVTNDPFRPLVELPLTGRGVGPSERTCGCATAPRAPWAPLLLLLLARVRRRR